jgi:hypothetical protein
MLLLLQLSGSIFTSVFQTDPLPTTDALSGHLRQRKLLFELNRYAVSVPYREEEKKRKQVSRRGEGNQTDNGLRAAIRNHLSGEIE